MKVNIWLILSASFFLFSIFGCNGLSSEQDKFPYDLMIGLTDLPNDYEYGGSGFENVEDGAKSFYLSYRKNQAN